MCCLQLTPTRIRDNFDDLGELTKGLGVTLLASEDSIPTDTLCGSCLGSLDTSPDLGVAVNNIYEVIMY